MRDYKAWYQAHTCVETRPYPGIPELLEQLRQRIAIRLGQLLRALLEENRDKRLMIIGGDTLLGFMTAIHCTELMPQRELTDGMVLSSLEKDGGIYQVITKSGGFGSDKLLLTL